MKAARLACVVAALAVLAGHEGQAQEAEQARQTRPDEQILVYVAASIVSQFQSIQSPGFEFSVIEDGPDLDFGQRFKNKARSYCAARKDKETKRPPEAPLMMIDQAGGEWRAAGPLRVRCGETDTGSDISVFGIESGQIVQSQAQWQARLRGLPAQLPLSARLGFLFTSAYHATLLDRDPAAARHLCPELSFSSLATGDTGTSWLGGFTYPLCAVNGQPIGAELDLALFGRFGFEEALRGNLDRLHFSEAERKKIVRYLLRRAATGLAEGQSQGPDGSGGRADLRYFQTDRAGSACSVEAEASHDAPMTGFSLGLDVDLSCTLALAGERHVLSRLRLSGSRKLNFKRYSFHVPNKGRSVRFIKTIRDGLLQSIAEDGKSLGLIVFFNDPDEPGFLLDNDQEARVVGQDILSVDTFTLSGAALEYRPRRTAPPCVLAPPKLVYSAISYDSACELRFSSANGFFYRLYSVSDDAEDHTCDEEQRVVAPDPGTTCRIAGVQCQDLAAARFIINVEVSKNAPINVCGEMPGVAP